MGLIKALMIAGSSVAADQWKEFFYCNALDTDTLAVKGQKVIGDRSSNKKASDNIISSGSTIAVADGQCMIIVEQGQIVEVAAEPGEYTFDSSTEPTVFAGGLTGLLESFQIFRKRFAYGGDTAKDQRVYYFNTKEILANKFGTQSPIPFRVVDQRINLDIDISVRCNGLYSYKLSNPILFYKNVCGNIDSTYTRDTIDAQLKSEFLSELQPCFAKISAMGIRYSELPLRTRELSDTMNQLLSEQWSKLRGISVVSVAINSATISEKDAERIATLQETTVYSNPRLAAAALVNAQAEAMKSAARNSAGAMNGFFGMNMANQTGGINAADLFHMGGVSQETMSQTSIPHQVVPTLHNTSWTCSCGTSNTGKFCTECGKAISQSIVCNKCGWKAPAGQRPKFCPECGDVINVLDM